MELEDLKALALKVKEGTATQKEINIYLNEINSLLAELTEGIKLPSDK